MLRVRVPLHFQLLALFLLCALPAMPVAAANATYQFTGQCSDCTGTGVGTLVLQNYVAGTPLTNANFVSFTYVSNLLSYSLAQGENPNLSGAIPASLPAAAQVQINGPGNKVLTSNSGSGYWCAGYSCSDDFGQTSSWALLAAPPATPPATGAPALDNAILASLAAGIAVMGATLLKRARA
jgi:hypothetical protein